MFLRVSGFKGGAKWAVPERKRVRPLQKKNAALLRGFIVAGVAAGLAVHEAVGADANV
jgi:hypothetical protein